MEEQSLEQMAGELLRQRSWRLALAESCTGGLVSHRITNVAGSSDYFQGGVTAYANEAKMSLLGVQPATLEQHGAVSRETVLEMAQGARRLLEAQVAVAVSGIAGPGGGTPEKPVGTVWIGLSAPGAQRAWHYQFTGDRLEVKAQAAQKALEQLVGYLQEIASEPVEVSARYSPAGVPTPTQFTWQGQVYAVDTVGRRWEEAGAQNMLVMTPGGQVFTLIFTGMQWFIRHSPNRRSTA
jgi:PncC family amidohydrolase